MTYALSWLADVLRTAGLSVTEVAGWQTRGHGDFGTPKGVLLHDTAGRPPPDDHPSLVACVKGRTGPNALAGPLCNLYVSRSGVFYTVAAGKGWHAGFGSWQTVPLGNFGNSQLIGIEAENTGVAGDPWPDVQMAALRQGVSALLKHIGAPAIMCAGHREYARTDEPGYPLGRKIDPDFDVPAFRKSLAV